MWPLLIEYADDHGIELDGDEDDDAERRLQLQEFFVELCREVEQMLTEDWPAIEGLSRARIEHKTLVGAQISSHAVRRWLRSKLAGPSRNDAQRRRRCWMQLGRAEHVGATFR